MKNFKNHKINLKNFTLVFTFLSLLSFTAVIFHSASVKTRFKDVNSDIEKFIISSKCSQTILTTSTKLSEYARIFVMTHDFSAAESYLKEINETQSQKNALRELQEICSAEDVAVQRLKYADSQAENLIELELYAMKLSCMALEESEIPQNIKNGLSRIRLNAVDIPKTKDQFQFKSIANLFGEGYLIYQKRIRENCTITLAAIEEQTQKELGLHIDELGEHLNHLSYISYFLSFSTVLFLIFIILLVIIPLKKFVSSIKQDKRLEVLGASELHTLANSYNEIYDIKAMNEKSLLKKAEYDSLTGILNRCAFDQICENSTKQRQHIALLLIDIDNFKTINDSKGHNTGDKVLQEVARILTHTFRQYDYIARIGGDEFAAILQNFRQEGGPTIINKIHRANEELSRLKEAYGAVSISAGIAFSESGFSQQLYLEADKALYKVKRNGKRGCRIYDHEIDEQ